MPHHLKTLGEYFARYIKVDRYANILKALKEQKFKVAIDTAGVFRISIPAA